MAAAVQGVVSKSDFAKHRGCSPAYVSKLIRIGRLAAPALLVDGRINVILADQMLGAPQAEEEKPTAAAPTHSDRQRRERAEADLRELELEERSGKLLRAHQVEAAEFERTRRTRDAILAVAENSASELHACQTDRALADLLRRRLTDALANLSADLEHEAEAHGA